MGKKKERKVRVDFRKNYGSSARPPDLTRQYQDQGQELDTQSSQRVSGKGDRTRRRTILTTEEGDPLAASGVSVERQQDRRLGRVLRVHGLECIVQPEGEATQVRCAVRGVLKTLSTDQRHVIVAGDVVRFVPQGDAQGMILSIEPRSHALARASKGKRHVIVANVDQLLIIVSAAEPALKPNLIDRFLATAEQDGLEPVIVINKCDLIDPASIQPLVGTYARCGYSIWMVSAARGWNIDPLRQVIAGRHSVVAGQSGVGKSSLLNALIPGWKLRVQSISDDNQKGRHTTTTAEWFPLEQGGALVDTPGIRQFQLWDIIPDELTSLFRDLRPFANRCRFPNCTHQHESDCAVKDAVADGKIDVRRYESFSHILDDPQGE
ncbi:MAG: ribosome small subunit-dependent GTPase A [Pirellulaceae bacterium]